jgi:hypothetical protein
MESEEEVDDLTWALLQSRNMLGSKYTEEDENHGMVKKKKKKKKPGKVPIEDDVVPKQNIPKECTILTHL